MVTPFKPLSRLALTIYDSTGDCPPEAEVTHFLNTLIFWLCISSKNAVKPKRQIHCNVVASARFIDPDQRFFYAIR
jgi:hypothetical protein